MSTSACQVSRKVWIIHCVQDMESHYGDFRNVCFLKKKTDQHRCMISFTSP
ncbi:hypothetical protein FQR65_LT10224 [Abscondita terminalis]|nr:hypothetical protein FQR65_LT10224 [Abscondita terminalis]